MAKQTKVKPTYLKGKKPITIGLHDVMRVMMMINDHGHTDKFQKAAKKKKAFMSVDPGTVNFVKDFVAQNKMHDHPIGKHIVKTQDKGAAPLAKAMAAAPKLQHCPYDCCLGD
jgi:hypothetical protein